PDVGKTPKHPAFFRHDPVVVFDDSMGSITVCFPASETRIRNDLGNRFDGRPIPTSRRQLANNADPSVYWRRDEHSATSVGSFNSIAPACRSMRTNRQRLGHGVEVGAPN